MLRLVKTTGGSHGSPHSCKCCGAAHFMKSGQAWHCSSCGLYVPAEFPKNSIINDLKNDIKKLEDLNFQLGAMIKQLEKELK